MYPHAGLNGYSRLMNSKTNYEKERPIISLLNGIFSLSCQVTRLIEKQSVSNARHLFCTVFSDPCKEVCAWESLGSIQNIEGDK